MIKPRNTIPFLLLLLLIALHSHEAIGKKHVHIFNRLEQGQNLTLHCQSADDDLGFVTISDGQEMTWSFKLNLWDSTLFYCRVRWPGSDGWLRFDAYDWERDHHRCSDCRWMIARDGFLYGYEIDTERWRLYPLFNDVPSYTLKD